MSSKHLTTGDPLPDLAKDKITLFSMLFCPFAQRVRLILEYKKLDYTVVNVNTKSKPDWLVQLNPMSQVPILHIDGAFISGSVEICEFLDEKYPEPSLDANILDNSSLVSNISPLISLYYKAAWKKDDKSFEEHMNGMKPQLEELENKLKDSDFFGGNAPKFADFMIWPWFERAGVLSITYNEKLPYNEFPMLTKWCEDMKKQECVSKVLIEPIRHYKATQFHLGAPPLYDEI
ncbi:unnamed protein product [Brassicogethes aeneus]|uniref:Glutathione-dependent dehydroascorbate reductase n=1 Tax=Brassicogethes aeneus TaxID=1431903 RepID=A0A9P0FFL1_BRAAE|nr:unnamed protein product [Brassicogethes aeneus]